MARSHSLAQAKYDSTHCRSFNLKINLVSDSDIIARLDSVDSKQGYIKQLIREDIARSHIDAVPISEIEIKSKENKDNLF